MSRTRIYLTEVETQALADFLNHRRGCSEGVSLTADLTSFRGAGTLVVVQCSECGKEKDITDR